MRYPILFALLTALFWGLYGPVLAQSRSMLLSPFKPYVAIGGAYLVWGILGGLVGMWFKHDSFTFTGSGTMWGFAAGSLGAWGALTLTLAMFTGGTGMPHVVMPIVFGGAVTVSGGAANGGTEGNGAGRICPIAQCEIAAGSRDGKRLLFVSFVQVVQYISKCRGRSNIHRQVRGRSNAKSNTVRLPAGEGNSR